MMPNFGGEITYLTVPKRSCYSLKQNNRITAAGTRSARARSHSPVNRDLKPYFRAVSDPNTSKAMNVGGRGVGGGGGNNNCVGGNNGVGNNNINDGGRNNNQPRKFQEKINLQNNRMAEQERAVQEALGFTKMLKGGQPGANNGNNAALGLNGTTMWFCKNVTKMFENG